MVRVSVGKREAFPVVVDTMPGRKMRISSIEMENHEGPRTFRRPHLLSPMHRKKKIELPF